MVVKNELVLKNIVRNVIDLYIGKLGGSRTAGSCYLLNCYPLVVLALDVVAEEKTK